MAVQHMLSRHSKKRDEYGLPIVATSSRIGFTDESSEEDKERIATWNADHKQLVFLTKEARRHIEEVVFILTWLMPHLHLHYYSTAQFLAGATINPSNDRSVQEEINLLIQIAEAANVKKERLARASAVFLEYAVSDISDRLLPRTTAENHCRPPQGFLRVWGSQSYTNYKEQLGFLCSSWTTCRPAPNLEELKQRNILSTEKLQSHCENRPIPSCWISLSGEASWMLKNINTKWPIDSVSTGRMRIALVSTAKMERLNLLYDRSDILVQCAGGRLYSTTNPNGIKFAWHSHYLVYGWIPVQCIVKLFTLAQFRDICKDRNIRPGQYLTYRQSSCPIFN